MAYEILLIDISDNMSTKIKVGFMILICILLVISFFYLLFYQGENNIELDQKEVVYPLRLTEDNYSYYHPYFSPDNNKIIFISNESDDGFFQVWVIDIITKDKEQLTFEPYNHYFPRYNSEGDKIIYTRNYYYQENESSIRRKMSAIWIMNSNGANKQLYIENAFCGSFNHDDTKVVFQKGRFYSDYLSGLGIEIINADGTNRSMKLNGSGGIAYIYPSFNKDGTNIIYTEHWLLGGIAPPYEIRILNLNNNSIIAFPQYYYNSYKPVFSPDNNHIYYIANGNIWKMNINGTNNSLVYDNEEEVFDFNISSDGEKIVYIEGNDIWIRET